MRSIPIEEIKAKVGLIPWPKPVILGLGIVIVMVAVVAGRLLLGTATANDIVVEPSTDDSMETLEQEIEDAPLYIHVSGAVRNPGLLSLPAGSRVGDAIDAAGGFSEGADIASVNLARSLTDGEQVHVVEEGASPPLAEGSTSTNPGTLSASGKVNINTASQVELETLSGIGPSLASRIIADRTDRGPFASPEDLKRVSGIGDKKFESLAASICV